jgi:hypothetical protein
MNAHWPQPLLLLHGDGADFQSDSNQPVSVAAIPGTGG